MLIAEEVTDIGKMRLHSPAFMRTFRRMRAALFASQGNLLLLQTILYEDEQP